MEKKKIHLILTGVLCVTVFASCNYGKNSRAAMAEEETLRAEEEKKAQEEEKKESKRKVKIENYIKILESGKSYEKMTKNEKDDMAGMLEDKELDEEFKNKYKDDIERIKKERKEVMDKEAEEKKAKEEAEKKEREEAKERAEKAVREEKEKRYDTGLTYDDMARNPEKNKNKYCKFTGKVLQVINGERVTQYRIAIDSNYDKVALVEVSNYMLNDGKILEDDQITIKGKFIGEYEYTTVMGAKNAIPGITVDEYTRK